MISLSDAVRTALERTGARTAYFYPKDFSVLPLVAWRESGNRQFAQADGAECLTEVEYSVDVWATGPAQCAALAEAVQAALDALGLRREFCADLFDQESGAFHRALRYRGVTDGETVYQ